ncbi:hypothetical protein JKP88DRAFT_182394 [Tribonema minus]|uniref:Intraflagellar transport protein 172 n=1 Tax=Tribonema minus TaxID=303371 RepID=A0A835YVD3_9STRA|nr:hypothetical protein JKP88DRAFT_182394 [Tribonema minus]
MQLRHLQTVLAPPGEGGSLPLQKVTAIAWAPNNRKLAVCTADRVVTLFDENGEKRDKFSTKPADKGPKNYMVRAMAFGPDSSRLAIAQTDNIVFVYKLGAEWGEKKSICNKFPQPSPVTALTWADARPNDIVFGLADGKVKIGQLRTNKPATLYNADSFVAALAASADGNGVVSAHADGAIYRFLFDDSGGGPSHARLAVHPCVPYALSWGRSIVAAGNDCQVVFYGVDGGLERTFDYSNSPKCKEFSAAAFNPSGDAVVVGNFNSFYVYAHNHRAGLWEEVGIKEVENMYTVTSLGWKADGSRLAVGTLCGVVDVYDACVKRSRYRGKFEFTYVSLSQVIVKRLGTGARIVLKSHFGCEILKINIFKDRYVAANTTETLLLGDLETLKLSEVPWNFNSGGEKFIFDAPAAALVFAAGELSVVEYGHNEVAAAVRTDHISAHLLSVRLNERPPRTGAPDDPDTPRADEHDGQNKKMAYLLDAQTVNVKNLVTQASVTVNHDCRIDWLELNSRGNLLLFRDKRRQLHLFNVDNQTRTTLLNLCNYVQWVPDSDVVVAQSRTSLCVWYNIHAPDQVTNHQIKGDVYEIERSSGRTEVIVNEGFREASYLLDEALIEFGTAIDDRDYAKAMEILEPLELTPEAAAMWSQLCDMALAHGDVLIAERCAAALGDVPRAAYLHALSAAAAAVGGGEGGGRDHWSVRHRMCLLRKDLKGAEDALLAQGRVEEAIAMYEKVCTFNIPYTFNIVHTFEYESICS